MTVVPT